MSKSENDRLPQSKAVLPDVKPPSSSLGPYLVGAGAVLLFLVGGLGAWAATTSIAGAVLASGSVVVDSNIKQVQHPTGGIVGEIRVKDGDRVKVGDLLLRLDETVTRANLQVITKQLDELAMRQARLKAERDEADEVKVPTLLTGRESDLVVQDIIAGEQSMFRSRRSGRESQKAQLKQRITQIGEEIQGLTRQLESKASERDLLAKERSAVETLYDQDLIALPRVIATQRDFARLGGDHGQLTSQIAQAKGKATEVDLQILQIDQDLRTEIVKELREAQSKEGELVERKVAAEDQLRRIDIRAPQSGTVHQLSAHTVGGVINQSEPIMQIVPENDRLVIEAKFLPQEIEQVRLARTALLRLTAFNQRTTPELVASIDRVAADVSHDTQTGTTFFIVRLSIAESELKKLNGGILVPGMPVDVQIKTEERTALSYFVRPVLDQFARTFKER